MLGPLINSACIIAGSALGVCGGKLVTPGIRAKLTTIFGCMTLGIGVFMTGKGSALPPVILSLLLGSFIGELCRVEDRVMQLAVRAVEVFQRGGGASDLPGQSFRDQFAVAVVLFSMSGLGIMGSMHEGVSGDPSLLIVKSVLDLPTAMIFAANIGGVVGILALPQLGVQAAIFFAAASVAPLASPAMLANFTACGGIIMLGTALRQFNLQSVPILNMLPGLVLVMPATALWAQIMGA